MQMMLVSWMLTASTRAPMPRILCCITTFPMQRTPTWKKCMNLPTHHAQFPSSTASLLKPMTRSTRPTTAHSCQNPSTSHQSNPQHLPALHLAHPLHCVVYHLQAQVCYITTCHPVQWSVMRKSRKALLYSAHQALHWYWPPALVLRLMLRTAVIPMIRAIGCAHVRATTGLTLCASLFTVLFVACMPS